MRRKWRCAHTGIGLAVAVGPGGRCTVPGLHLQRVRSLLLAIEHHLREDLSGLPIDLEVILPFVPVAVHHVISDLKRKSDHVENDTPFRTIIINLFPFLLITRCYLQHINKFDSLLSFLTKFFFFACIRFLGLETKLSGGRMVKIVGVIWFIKIEKSYTICHKWTYVRGIYGMYEERVNVFNVWNCIISKLLEGKEEKKCYSFPSKSM